MYHFCTVGAYVYIQFAVLGIAFQRTSSQIRLDQILNDLIMVNKIQKLSSFKSNENIHKREDGSYYVVSANKASSVTL